MSLERAPLNHIVRSYQEGQFASSGVQECSEPRKSFSNIVIAFGRDGSLLDLAPLMG